MSERDETESGGLNYDDATVRCGCGDFAVDIDSREYVRAVDIICPECKNHFGWAVPEGEFRKSRGLL